ncbi:MAG: cytochrome C [Rhodoferax sp.]|nr:cytochrome C [Rhodoferax sp.]
MEHPGQFWSGTFASRWSIFGRRQHLAKKSDCLKCHAVDKDKKAASFKSIAEKWKGKADAQAKVTESITKGPKVKLKDGTEETHKVIASQDANDIKNVVDWILSR